MLAELFVEWVLMQEDHLDHAFFQTMKSILTGST